MVQVLQDHGKPNGAYQEGISQNIKQDYLGTISTSYLLIHPLFLVGVVLMEAMVGLPWQKFDWIQPHVEAKLGILRAFGIGTDRV